MKRPNVRFPQKFLADFSLLAVSLPAMLFALSEDRPMTGGSSGCRIHKLTCCPPWHGISRQFPTLAKSRAAQP